MKTNVSMPRIAGVSAGLTLLFALWSQIPTIVWVGLSITAGSVSFLSVMYLLASRQVKDKKDNLAIGTGISLIIMVAVALAATWNTALGWIIAIFALPVFVGLMIVIYWSPLKKDPVKTQVPPVTEAVTPMEEPVDALDRVVERPGTNA